MLMLNANSIFTLQYIATRTNSTHISILWVFLLLITCKSQMFDSNLICCCTISKWQKTFLSFFRNTSFSECSHVWVQLSSMPVVLMYMCQHICKSHRITSAISQYIVDGRALLKKSITVCWSPNFWMCQLCFYVFVCFCVFLFNHVNSPEAKNINLLLHNSNKAPNYHIWAENGEC